MKNKLKIKTLKTLKTQKKVIKHKKITSQILTKKILTKPHVSFDPTVPDNHKLCKQKPISIRYRKPYLPPNGTHYHD